MRLGSLALVETLSKVFRIPPVIRPKLAQDKGCKMKKLLVLTSLIITNNAIAAQTVAPMMMSAVATSMAMHANNQAHKAANTVGLGVLAGKQIENCLILQAYWSDGKITCVCLNKDQDEVYSVSVRKPKGDFSQGVFDELRKQFNK